MRRHGLILCASLLLGVLASANQAAAATKIALAKVANDFALQMADYGNKLGIFARHGLDVQTSLITQAKMIQAVVAGSIDMALASGATVAFAPKGAPLKGVAALSGPPDRSTMPSPKNKPLNQRRSRPN